MHASDLSRGRLLLGFALLICIFIPVSASGTATAQPARVGIAAAPDPPVWPIPELADGFRSLLVGFYDKEADPGTPYYRLAPEWESDKQEAAKDPDTLLEHGAGPGSACHAATSVEDFVDCTGHRLAAIMGQRYSGGLTLTDRATEYSEMDAVAQMAGYNVLYHAFVRDFDASLTGDYAPEQARDAKLYHERMMAGYEAHMRDAILKMFRDRRSEPRFQLDMTRSVGLLAANYVRALQAIEESGAWRDPTDRRNALAVVSGLNQRLWWEWVWTQAEGPRTAGFADLGSEATYEAAVAADPVWEGTNRFTVDGATIMSLRPARADTGMWSGLWFDADYVVPGEWWCHGRFQSGTSAHTHCLELARREARDGTLSPFGQYYADTDADPACGTRSATLTAASCNMTNSGSSADEWTAAFLGARLGTFLMKELADSGDPDLPAGEVGTVAYGVVTARLGYGVAGWHGGTGHSDDLEWQFGGQRTTPIRTLSAARHDLEMQNGLYSLGETDVGPDAVGGRKGDSWPEDRQEYPGGIETFAPGPNPAYGAHLFWLVLSDSTSDGLSPSLYDEWHRNEVDEFLSWVWLMQATYFRCLNVADPSDPSCLAYSAAYWPYPTTINRQRLYTRPEDSSIRLQFRYLWRDPMGVLDQRYMTQRDLNCRGEPGTPLKHVHDWATNDNAGYLYDESGGGAYNSLIKSLGGLMRLLAARYPLAPVDPGLADEYARQRDEVIAPWYADAYDQVEGILALYAEAYPFGYGYVPAIENSTCAGYDPLQPGNPSSVFMMAWQVGTADSVSATAVRRAAEYAMAAQWYWWYAGDWLDIDAATW